MCMCVFVYVYVCMCVCVYVYACMCMRVYVSSVLMCLRTDIIQLVILYNII